MKPAKQICIAIIFMGLFFSNSVFSHPYNSTLKFIKHKRDGGGVIYTNIPKSCFKNGILLCHDYYQLKRNGSSVLTQGSDQKILDVKIKDPAIVTGGGK